MQLYAFDENNQFIHARQALKQKKYYCIECQEIVHLRGGPSRQIHFYHIDPTPLCRQSQKTASHLQLQIYLVHQFSSDDSQLEYRFPTIQRIADVAWFSKKIVFEIQYSPISAEEVAARTHDYTQIGWHIVWILHDHLYNKNRLSAAEAILSTIPHFFTNMNSQGQGMIYDQFQICQERTRRVRFAPLPIDIKHLKEENLLKDNWPLLAQHARAKYWKVSFQGDLMSLCIDPINSKYLQSAA
jgi:competence protein CoiA